MSTLSPLPPPPSLPSSLQQSNTTTNTTTNTTASSSSQQILTQKVHNAISLNTTAPSFASALRALSTLQTPNHHHHYHNNSNNSKVDAKSIRTAIEQDALYHAQCLEDEMRRLVRVVKDMRGSIQSVVTIAEGVKESVKEVVPRGAVVGVIGGKDGEEEGVVIPPGMSQVHANTSTNSNINSNSNSNNLGVMEEKVPFEQERKLAEMLAHAFRERNEAKMRYESVREFLEKYNLDPLDSALLEEFTFENIQLDPSSSSHPEGERGGKMKEGMAFLNALQRVSVIRKKLSWALKSSSTVAFSKVDHDDMEEEEDGMEGNDGTRREVVQMRQMRHKLGPASALRMVESLASKQDDAFERLYHFLHSRLDLARSSSASSLGGMGGGVGSNGGQSNIIQIQDDLDETLLHPFIQRSIYVLRQVPAYYKHTLELIASSRRAEVTRKFLLALTSGYEGMAPIEMKAHDPVNYVGDMLAFVFRSLSVESELARGLFVEEEEEEVEEEGEVEMDSGGAEKKKQEEEDEDEADDDEEFQMTATEILKDVMSGVARPLKSRMSHVIASLATRQEEEGDDHLVGGFQEEEERTARNRLASLYSICGLIFFYHSAMEKAIQKLESTMQNTRDVQVRDDPDALMDTVNPLVRCLRESLSEGAKAFVASLKVYVATLETMATSSNRTQAVVASEVILRLCQVRGASPGFGIVMEKVDEETRNALTVEFLCDHVLEPVFPLCTNIEDLIGLKSALKAMRKVGLGTDSATKWEAIFMDKEKMLLDSQLENDVKEFLDESGLGRIVTAIENMEAVYVEGMTVSSHPGLSQESLQKAIEVFYATLYDPPIPSYVEVKDPGLRRYARNKVVEDVTALYGKIYDLCQSDRGGYENVSFFKYDKVQVKAMLSS